MQTVTYRGENLLQWEVLLHSNIKHRYIALLWPRWACLQANTWLWVHFFLDLWLRNPSLVCPITLLTGSFTFWSLLVLYLLGILQQYYMTAKSESCISFMQIFFLPEDNGTRPTETAIKHIGHAIKATSQHSSSLTNFTFLLTLSINLLLFCLPYVLTQHVITVQNTSLLLWHTTFACQLS